MTALPELIETGVRNGLETLYGVDASGQDITLQSTRKEFEGEYTVVTFPLTRLARKKPEQIGEELGQYLRDNFAEIKDYNVIKGFLNLVIDDAVWTRFLLEQAGEPGFGRSPDRGERVVVEFASPNTNKPLHLGHVRNILLGWATSQLLDAAGFDVKTVQIINDRGIAICKSMLAWERFGKGATPKSTGVKPDHFVGEYYVLFETRFQEEYRAWQQSEDAQVIYEDRKKKELSEKEFWKSYKNTYFNTHSELGAAAKEMLLKWEDGDVETVALWNRMNGWVYEGFDETYERMGVRFDKLYYESQTYLLGKDMVDAGLDKGVFYRKEDGSVFVDLTDAKLDQKALLRADGTSLYITQDLGTARLRYDDFGATRMVYTVADEQNYHFQVLFEILKRLEEPYADGLYHLSYGMVDLPSGRMKSREGTVVDADDLMDEVIQEAYQSSLERESTSDLSEEERREIIRKVGMAALKFQIIKVGPQKRMVFDPKESVDLQGQTGPYVQNAFVRTRAVWRKAGSPDLSAAAGYTALEPTERELISQLYSYPTLLRDAAENYDPSLVAMYCYELAKNLHKFWHDVSILNAGSEAATAFRLRLCQSVGNVLESGMGILGIEMPERM
ncbi:arginyl-tRNA synthetase [Lewinella marina]|uniref:Arginine--tRNA ligase n=1 Tax=Neolewinella marina TaxID=438751 RepID=A0A2G0CFE4_9BACT|nr:arginine--tRNA ligase [Neolewinella marina]NJB85612.1 arginyl-tRNA synthetase [Neolewinella marina]PHK98703.1 arginine--tRNA ligase [Neolewinella marina]